MHTRDQATAPAALLAPLIGDEQTLQELCTLTGDILNGVLPAAAHKLLTAAREVPFAKPNGALRPVNPCEPILQVAGSYALDTIPKTELAEIFGSTQLTIGTPGGAEKSVHLLKAAIESRPADDSTNTFGSVRRTKIMVGIVQDDALKPLFSYFHWLLSRRSTLVLQDPSCNVVSTFLCAEGHQTGLCARTPFVGAATLGACREVEGVPKSDLHLSWARRVAWSSVMSSGRSV